jgi:hypothetical protein
VARPFSFINRLAGVFDDPTQAADAARRLVAAGIPDEDIDLLRGEEGVRTIDSSGSRSLGQRAVRVSQYLSADSSADFVIYDAALREGRAVVAARIRDRSLKPAAIAAMRDAGGHFISFYGRFQTEEIDRWRGEPIAEPPFLPPPRARE